MPFISFKLRATLPILSICALLLAATPASGQTSQTLIFPQIAVGGGFQTIVTLIHSDERSTAAATGTLSFFNQDGTARTVTTTELGSGSSFAVTVPYQGVTVVTLTSSDAVVVGMGKFVGAGIAVQGMATFRALSGVVGGLAADVTNVGYIPLETSTGFGTGVAITNPELFSINLTLRIRNADGTIAETSTPAELNPLVPNGHYAKFAGPEMGFSSSLPANSSLEIAVNGSGRFAALALLLGNLLLSSSSVITEQVNTPVIFPQIADGGGFTTITRMFNPSSSTFSGTINYYNPDGTARSIALSGMGTATSFALSIPAKGTAVLQTTGTDSAVSVGMARVESDTALGGVSTIFEGTTHIGVPGTTPMRSGRVAIDTTNGNTGIALAGTGDAAASISLTLQDGNGNGAETVAPSGLNPLAANGQLARFVHEVGFTDTTNRPDSSILVQSSGGSFAPLVLLQSSNGVFSSGAIGRQVLLDPVTDWAGTYNGTWISTTFGSTGAVALTIAVDVPNETATVTMDLGGFVFGGNDPVVETFTAPMTFDGYRSTATSTVFGPWTLLVRPDGALSIRASNVPSSFVDTFSMDGTFTGTGFTGTYSVLLPGGSPAVGTWSAN